MNVEEHHLYKTLSLSMSVKRQVRVYIMAPIPMLPVPLLNIPMHPADESEHLHKH